MEGGPLLSDWWVKACTSFTPYLNITSHIESHPDQGMLRKKGGSGFPYFVVMSAEAEVLSRFRPTSPEALEKAIASGREFLEIEKRVAQNPEDHQAKARFLISKLELNENPELFDELEKLIESSDRISTAVCDDFAVFRTRRSVRLILDSLQAAARSSPEDYERAQSDAYDRILAMHRVGEAVSDSSHEEFSIYWSLVFGGAVAKKDKKAGSAALKALSDEYGGQPGMKRRLEAMQKALDEIDGR